VNFFKNILKFLKMKEIFWNKVITLESFPFITSQFKVIQTHISYVFITDDIVYKIKKPVNLGFLDFSTLEKRKYFCEKEVELNRRLCPEIYLGVVPIIKKGETFKFENQGEIVEYAVKMRKLPENGMMSLLLQEKNFTEKHIDLIVDTLVPFYKKAQTGENVNIYGSKEIIFYNINENFEQTKEFVGLALTEEKYKYLIDFNMYFIKEKENLFKERIEKGFIREGHGDLYSANICFDDLKKVYIFDCIEFNERFRCGDVCCDISFLAMDLDYHRFRNLSQYFIENYVNKSKDFKIFELLDFYKCYRAYVRGKIGCFTYVSSQISEEERKKALESAQKYFDLAYFYAGGIPKVIIFFGLSGTGKTFLSQKLLGKIPAVYLASDIIRKKLLNLDPHKHYYAPFEKGIYSPDITEKTYKKLAELAFEELSYGRDVIIDATFREKKLRELFKNYLKNVKAKFYWIWCKAEDEVIKGRIFKRKKENTYSDALWNIYLSQKEKFDHPEDCSPLLALETSSPEKDLLEKIIEFLKI